jgi:hypothetical protein
MAAFVPVIEVYKGTPDHPIGTWPLMAIYLPALKSPTQLLSFVPWIAVHLVTAFVVAFIASAVRRHAAKRISS